MRKVTDIIREEIDDRRARKIQAARAALASAEAALRNAKDENAKLRAIAAIQRHRRAISSLTK